MRPPARSPLTNLITPQQKLLSKTRVGAKVTKKYDTTNPAQLRHEIGDLQDDPLNKVKHKNITRRNKQNAVYLSRAKLDESTSHPSRAS